MLVIVLAILLALPLAASAQTGPNWPLGYVPSPSEWNSAFTSKTDLNVTATGSSTARTAADRFAQVVNVKDYGVRCDSSTDDRGNINSALSAASSGNIKTV